MGHGYRRLGLGLALLLGLCLTIAWAKPGAIGSSSASRGSQIVLTLLQEPGTFNPALNGQFPSVFQFAFRGLTIEDGATGDVKPALAESWAFSEDKRRLVFTLRSNLKWSDGAPLTADDVVFTYRDVVFNDKIPTPLKDGLRIGANRAFPIVQKLDDRRIEFLLPQPFAPILRVTAARETGIHILPKHILADSIKTLDANGNPLFISTWNTGTPAEKIVTNGPYVMERYVPGQRVIFRRNPHYWERDESGRQLPYIDRIVWQVMQSTDAQLLRFRSNDLDVLGDVRPLRPEYFSLLKKEENRGKFKVLVGGPWSGTTYIAFNLNKAKNAQGKQLVDPIKSRWFNTLAFRQAVAHAIDRPRMVNNIYRGISQPQNSPISVQSPFYLSPDRGLKTYDYSIEKAKQLLQQAGFKYDAAGQLFDRDGNRVKFTLNTNAGNRIREALGSQIKVDLSKIGMQVDFAPIDFNTLIGKLDDSRDWDCYLIGFTGGIEPNDAANLWLSTGNSHSFNLAPQAGQPPIVGWQANDWEKEIDRLFNEGAQELDEAKRKLIYEDFQRIVQAQLPVIHLVNEIALMAVRDRVQGLQYSGLPTWGLWNIERLKVEDEG